MSVSPLTQLSLTAQTVQALLRGETLPEPANYEAYGEYHDLVFRLNLLTAIDPTHAEQLWALESLEAPKLEAMVNGINQEGLVHAADLFPVMKEWYDHGAPKGVSPGWTSLEREYRVLPTEMTVITGTPSAGKALALDTLLPTPSGWTTMGEVSPGDVVFDERGVPCRVLRVTEVMFGRPCFQVTFSDGTTVIADADHQWVTRDEKSRNSHWNAHKRNRLIDRPLLSRGTDQSHKRTYPSVRSTREIADSLWTTGNTPRYNHCVAVAEAMILPETELPIEPYLLGLWLGDGDSKASSITASIEDIPWYLNDIWAAGYYTNLRAGSSPTNGRISVSCVQPRRGHIHGSLKAILRNIGVLRNKHIPLAYLRSSVSQRLALLQGLMDTDGSVSPRSGTCEFTSTNLELANGIVELIVTLGWRVKMKQGKATLRGRAIGPKYRVRFTPSSVNRERQRRSSAKLSRLIQSTACQ
jgi:replicative DNA helicase